MTPDQILEGLSIGLRSDASLRSMRKWFHDAVRSAQHPAYRIEVSLAAAANLCPVAFPQRKPHVVPPGFVQCVDCDAVIES